MNNIIGKVLLFVGGGAVGFLTAKVVYTKYYENLIEEEITNVKDAYDAALVKLDKDMKADTTVKKEERKIQNQITNKNALVRSDEGNQYNQIKKIYNIDQDDSGHPADEEDIDDEYLDDTAYGNPVENINPIPYIISEDSFMNEWDQHDKVSMDFYILDKILTDEVTEPLEYNESIMMIGVEAMSKLCTATQDTVVYIRNEKLRIDYEIGTINDSFSAEPDSYSDLDWKPEVIKKNLTPREAYEYRVFNKDMKKGGE